MSEENIFIAVVAVVAGIILGLIFSKLGKKPPTLQDHLVARFLEFISLPVITDKTWEEFRTIVEAYKAILK